MQMQVQMSWDRLLEIGYLEYPKDFREWRAIAEDFENKWNFPSCLGAINGKHVIIQCPANSGSSYYNYKKFHSIILIAVLDANCKFIMDDIRDYGRYNDGNVFTNSIIGKASNSELLDVTNTRRLDSSNTKISICNCWG